MTTERRRFTVYAVLIAGLVMLLAALSILSNATPSAAAPEAAPTPLSNPVHSEDALNVEFWNTTVLTADTASGGKQLPTYETLDLSYTVDQATLTNTTTVKIQFSNDNTNWIDGVAIVTSNAADASGLVQLNNFGRYTRVYADVANTNPVTWTILAVAK